jgi:predicted RNA binding protein YcfA (HicA-like mRNA interferase family)
MKISYGQLKKIIKEALLMNEIADPKYRDFSRFLKEKGFYKAKAEGSHEIWLNGKGNQLSVPSHKEIRIGSVEQILKNMGPMPDKSGEAKVWTVKDYFKHTRG